MGVGRFVVGVECVGEVEGGWSGCRRGGDEDVGGVDGGVGGVMVEVGGRVVGDVEGRGIGGGRG